MEGFNEVSAGRFTIYVPTVARMHFQPGENVTQGDVGILTPAGNIVAVAKQFQIGWPIRLADFRTEWVADTAAGFRTRVLLATNGPTNATPYARVTGADTDWFELIGTKNVVSYGGGTAAGNYRKTVTPVDILQPGLYWQLVLMQTAAASVNWTRGSSLRCANVPDADLTWGTAGDTGIANASYATIDNAWIDANLMNKATSTWYRAGLTAAWHFACWSLGCEQM